MRIKPLVLKATDTRCSELVILAQLSRVVYFVEHKENIDGVIETEIRYYDNLKEAFRDYDVSVVAKGLETKFTLPELRRYSRE